MVGTEAAPRGTQTAKVVAAVRDGIAARSFVAGDRLPSVRVQAKALKVSVSTVVEAYERLAADGVVRARPGSGFYVCGPQKPLELARVAPRLDRAVDPLWVSRQSLEADEATLKPGCGWLPPSWMFEAGVRRGLRAAARAGAADLVDYGSPLGHPGLRALLARRMAAHGIEAGPDQVMLAESGTQALDLVFRFLLEPGDRVLLDDPCYFNFRALLKAHRVEAVGVPRTPTGPDVEAFAAAVEAHAPRLYVTNAAIHNPTGATLTLAAAHRIVALAERAGMTIVEDDIFADFEETPAPRLAALDGLSGVVHIGSFSKTLSASVRCGYVAARPEWIDGLVDLKIATSFGGGRLAAEVVLTALAGGGYRRHMEALRARLGAAMGETIGRLERLGFEPWIRPRAGMFVWARAPEGVDAAAIAQLCLKDGVVLAPGPVFSPSGGAKDFLRFNVAQCGDVRAFAALERAVRASTPPLSAAASSRR